MEKPPGSRSSYQLTNLRITDSGKTIVATAPSGLLLEVAGLVRIWIITTAPANIIHPLIVEDVYDIACDIDGEPGNLKGYNTGTGPTNELAFRPKFAR